MIDWFVKADQSYEIYDKKNWKSIFASVVVVI